MRLCCCNKYKLGIKNSSPFLYKLIFTRRYKCLKRFFSFLLGVAFGIGFYFMILIDLDFTENAAIFATLAICALLGFGNAFSSQIRCITMLTIPSFGGKIGRSVIKTFVLAFIISGPIENITNNGKEVVRVFACSTSLTFNLTKTRFELMFRPFTEALFGMKADVNEAKDTLRSMRDVSAPIVGEVEDEQEMRKMKEENDYLDEVLGDSSRSKEIEEKYETKGEKIEAQKFEKMYLKKIEMRCEDQFTKAAKNCRNMFEKGYNTCYDTVTWMAAWILCWPMKLDFVCNIAQALGGTSRCDPSKDIDPGFGDGYAYLKNSRSQFSENFKNVKLQYQLVKFKPPIDFVDTRDTATAILHVFTEKKAFCDAVFTILKRFLAFMFLRIIMSAQKYHDKYLRDVQFDNIYITTYFRKLDSRRRNLEKHTVLPLKKIEQKKLTDPCSPVPLKKERQQLSTQAIILALEIISATTFILIDWLFYEALDLVRRHARIDYVQTGKHDMSLQIKGTGMIANLLRSIVRGFNIKKRINIERSNVKCLPQPSLLPRYYLYKIYGTYLAVAVLIWAQMYTQRCQRVICSYFYPKKEKRRILFLYNETLRRRIGFLRFMRKKVQKLVRERRLQENYNVLLILKLRFPKLFGFLRVFKSARRKCLICQEVEPLSRRKSSKFEECQNDGCHFIYCEECWTDLGKECVACAAAAAASEDGSDGKHSDTADSSDNDDD